MKIPTRREILLARAVAIAADALQLAVFPLFAEGFISPLDLILDAAVCYFLTRLVGWHYAFLPAFFTEALPILDLVPNWTMAVFLATRSKATAAASAANGPSQPVLEASVKILETSFPGEDARRRPLEQRIDGDAEDA